MTIRTRILIAFVLIVFAGFYCLVDWVVNDLRRHHLQTMEEAMVDTATILSSYLAVQAHGENLPLDDLRRALAEASRRAFSARIYELVKTHSDMQVYVTDRHGIVLYDSGGTNEGQDYSGWRDVQRTLRGEYGARATRTDPDDPRTSVLHVAAPIRINGVTVGVLTVCKPVASVTVFIEAARSKVIRDGIVACLGVVLLWILVSEWVTGPIRRLTAYAQSIRDGRRVTTPRLGRSDIGRLGQAFEEMRETLEGRRYVEQYVQNLTHEIKGPLAAIRGAAELLQEDMPPEQRAKFARSIQGEAERMQSIVDRLLELAAVERRKALDRVEAFPLAALVRETLDALQPSVERKSLTVELSLGDPPGTGRDITLPATDQARASAPARSATTEPVVRGDRLLLRQALANLLQNAVDFSPASGRIEARLVTGQDHAEIRISDNGPGVPDYALDRVFDRFYSLPRPDTGRRSSGLGLALVREIAQLHGGSATLENRPDGGAIAILRLPLNVPSSTPA